MSGSGRTKGQQGQETHLLSEAVREYLSSEGYREADSLASIQLVWHDVLGEEAARHTRPKALRNGQLLVAVDHPSWATQMLLSSDAVLGRLHERLGDLVVGELKVHVEARFGVE